MAKKAKKELTLEEKLQNALVADWEQPYALPENWVWSYIGLLFDVTSSKRVHKSDWLRNGVPFYRTRELVKLSDTGIVDNELFISVEMYSSFNKNFGVPKIGDLLVSGVGTIGVPYVIRNNDKFYFKDGNIIWLKNKTNTVSKFIYFLYKSDFIYNQIKSLSAGTTVDTYTIINAKKTKVPLPPLAEQERIVQRIESLFAKLDTAKELLKEALESFESRKSALLHQAFTGELTKTWREKHGESMESWEEKKLNDICDFKSGHPFDSKKFSNTGLQVIRMGNLYNAVLDLTRNPVFFQKSDIDDKIFQKSLIKKGEILLTLTGTKYKRDYGYAILFEGEEELLLNQRIISLTPKSVNTKLILFLLRSDIFRDVFFSNETGGVNQGNVSVTFVKQITINLPTLPEQEEIVRILDAQLQKEEKASAHIQHSLAHIEHMKKAILARAFRGELGTNNPEEASAMELLKEILQQG